MTVDFEMCGIILLKASYDVILEHRGFFVEHILFHTRVSIQFDEFDSLRHVVQNGIISNNFVHKRARGRELFDLKKYFNDLLTGTDDLTGRIQTNNV